MQYISFLLILFLGLSTAAKPVFDRDYSAIKPGSGVMPESNSNRSRLFPDRIPGAKIGFSTVKASESFQAKTCKDGLKLVMSGDKPTGNAELRLNLPKCDSNITFEIKLKLADFIKGKTVPNTFFIYAAGVNLFFRSDRKDLRCYSMKSKSYARIAMMKNDTWYDIKAVMRFGAKGESFFDLYLNGKELLKNSRMRGKPSKLSFIRFTMNSKALKQPAPAVIIKSIKIY